MIPFHRLVVTAALGCWLLHGSELAGQRIQSVTQEACNPCVKKRVGLALGEVVATNLFVMGFNAFIKDEEWAKVSWDSWKNNIKEGFNFDDNAFQANQFAHPYHGSLYFNAARSNGMSYWESIPFPFLGSLLWEYFGETFQPSFNDLINTSFGGIALGEMTHRLASNIRDNKARGSRRFWHEVAALPLDPIGGATRLWTGDYKRIAENPEEHNASLVHVRLSGGARLVSDGSDLSKGEVQPFMELQVDHGDVFDVPYSKPFDVFTVTAQLNSGDTTSVMGRVQVLGRLYGKNLGGSSPARHYFAIGQAYDYFNTSAYLYGNQAVDAGVISRFDLGKKFGLRTTVSGRAIIMGAVSSEYVGVNTRPYDYGPGLGLHLTATLYHSGQQVLSVTGHGNYIHTVNGSDGNHLVELIGADLRWPINQAIGIGASGYYYYRNSYYATAVDVHRKTPQARVYLAWQLQ